MSEAPLLPLLDGFTIRLSVCFVQEEFENFSENLNCKLKWEL
jgi:hypothetical protein